MLSLTPTVTRNTYPVETKPVTAAGPGASSVTFVAGQTISPAVEIGGKLVGLIIPNTGAAWTAADLTFKGSIDGVNFYDIYDGATQRKLLSANLVAGRFLALQLGDWLGFSHIKLVSSAAQVNAVIIPLSLAG